MCFFTLKILVLSEANLKVIYAFVLKILRTGREVVLGVLRNLLTLLSVGEIL